MAGVTGHKGPWDNILGTALRAVVEALGNPLTHLVNRPPGHFFDIQRVGIKNLPRPGDNVFFVKPDIRRPLVLAQQIQFNIKPAQVTALAGDSHYSPMVLGLDKALDADIGKVCCQQNVHHAPGFVGGVAMQGDAQAFTNLTSGAVTACYIFRADGLCPARPAVFAALKRGGNGVSVQVLRKTFIYR